MHAEFGFWSAITRFHFSAKISQDPNDVPTALYVIIKGQIARKLHSHSSFGINFFVVGTGGQRDARPKEKDSVTHGAVDRDVRPKEKDSVTRRAGDRGNSNKLHKIIVTCNIATIITI